MSSRQYFLYSFEWIYNYIRAYFCFTSRTEIYDSFSDSEGLVDHEGDRVGDRLDHWLDGGFQRQLCPPNERRVTMRRQVFDAKLTTRELAKKQNSRKFCVCGSQGRQCIFSTSDQNRMRKSSFQQTFRWGILQRGFSPYMGEQHEILLVDGRRGRLCWASHHQQWECVRRERRAHW